MGATDLSASLQQLYHPFRQKIVRVLAEVTKETGEPWGILEGYRSPERQTLLWEQGRTRPGRIVTDHRTPRWHAAGLAAHLHPKARSFSAPMSMFERLREIYLEHGLSNPYWGKGNRAHVQMGDHALRLAGLRWVREGFPASVLETLNEDSRTEIRILVNWQLISDADAYYSDGYVYVALRPLADAFDWVILPGIRKQGAVTEVRIISDRFISWFPVVNGFIRIDKFPVFGEWSETEPTVHFTLP